MSRTNRKFELREREMKSLGQNPTEKELTEMITREEGALHERYRWLAKEETR